MSPSSSTNVDDLQLQIKMLQQEWQSFQRSPAAHPSSNALEEQVRDVTGQLKILQQHILGSGVQIGSKVFSVILRRQGVDQGASSI
jgi:hypothetical protein